MGTEVGLGDALSSTAWLAVATVTLGFGIDAGATTTVEAGSEQDTNARETSRVIESRVFTTAEFSCDSKCGIYT